MKVYVILVSYYGQTQPCHFDGDLDAAIRCIEDLAKRVVAVRRQEFEHENRLRFYSNHSAYTYELYEGTI